MKFYREITQWADAIPNHTYLLTTDKSKMHGYIKSGTTELINFKKPIRFDVRGRKFELVPELGEVNLDEPKAETWKFVGSKGTEYFVTKQDNQLKCSCPGFTYRGDCKHVKEVENAV